MIWLFLKDYNKSSKDFKRLYLHEKKKWFYFYLQKILQHIFIYGLMFFCNLFLLKEIIFTIQFDFIYKKIIFTTLIWKIIFTNLFKKFWFYLGKKKF